MEIEKERRLYTDLPKHGVNPFVEEVVLGARKVTKRRKGKEGEAQEVIKLLDAETLLFERTEAVDEEEFVKVFLNELRRFLNLSIGSRKVLDYLFGITAIDQAYVLLSLADCMKWTGYKSAQSVYDALVELADAGVIAKSRKRSVIFINPAIFFRGNRLKLVKEFRKKTDDFKKRNGL